MAPDINTRCKCGHPNGEHYSKSGWPACSQCEDCREFKPTAEFYTDLGDDVSLTSDSGEKTSIGRYGVWSILDGKKPQVVDTFFTLEELEAKYGKVRRADIGRRELPE